MKKAIVVTTEYHTYQFIIDVVLKDSGFSSYIMRNGNEVRRILNHWIPEIIIIDTPLPDEYGYELAEMMSEISEVILLCERDMVDEMAARLYEYGVTILPKPLFRDDIIEAVNQKNFSEIKESSEVLSRIENIRIINRAKSLLMKYLKFTEPQAHRYIEKQAMNNRCTRRESAEKIINTYGK